MLPCPHPGCVLTFSSQHGRTRHFRATHEVTNGRPIGVGNIAGSSHLRKEHPHLTEALPCDSDGNFLPPGAPPQPRESASEGGWAPFENGVQFHLADLLYRRAEVSATNIDDLLRLWNESMAGSDTPAPFESHEHMYRLIDSSCLVTTIPEDVNETSPTWMRTAYEVWYRDSDAVVSAMLGNPDFQGQFDLCPYIDVNADGTRRWWSNIMSGNIAWRRSDDIFAANPGTKGAMYCPIILGSDKTTVSVATGYVEYHPLYISIGNPHNTVRRAHRNAVIPIAFLAVPKCDRRYDKSKIFWVFKRRLYHASISAVLASLRPGMTAPVIRRCPDGHFRRVIYDIIAFIADYPEQVMLTGIVSGWCPKCTAVPGDMEAYAIRRTPRHTEVVRNVLDSESLWVTYGLDSNIVPFAFDFPRADIYEMMSPDLLHQLIKGIFKDHLVTWVCRYLVAHHGIGRANAILDDIDRRISVVPPFPGLCRFPHGRRFKQWTGDDSKALMKVYLPAIVGYVPEDVLLCLTAFMDACYIARRQCIDSEALNAFNGALDKFRQLREIFRTSGVRPKGFSLPRQHSIFHYRRMIEDFGAPGGLCSSITESRHITAVKKPWRRSNRYEALGQMLLINQRLDKLTAMRSYFTAAGLLPAHHSPHIPSGGDNEDDDGGPVEDDILGHVVLARTPGVTPDEIPPLNCKVSVFHSAVATFYSPSDPCGTWGMRRERIRSTPSWRGREPRRDCAFIVEDDAKPGMLGMTVVRIQLFFSIAYEGVYYPCALVEWFTKVGNDRVTGLWVVRPDITRGKRDRTVVHLDSLLRAAHLIPVYGNREIPKDFHYTYSLDSFKAYYVNKYIDHHANEIAF
ncbi:hypothetical protein H4582DRAFT_2111606 [Lactarius indigo]|nr:hypothetical protein H4582DRAFT_2111606 [Lactarius indigo]